MADSPSEAISAAKPKRKRSRKHSRKIQLRQQREEQRLREEAIKSVLPKSDPPYKTSGHKLIGCHIEVLSNNPAERGTIMGYIDAADTNSIGKPGFTCSRGLLENLFYALFDNHDGQDIEEWELIGEHTNFQIINDDEATQILTTQCNSSSTSNNSINKNNDSPSTNANTPSIDTPSSIQPNNHCPSITPSTSRKCPTTSDNGMITLSKKQSSRATTDNTVDNEPPFDTLQKESHNIVSSLSAYDVGT